MIFSKINSRGKHLKAEVYQRIGEKGNKSSIRNRKKHKNFQNIYSSFQAKKYSMLDHIEN